MSRSPVPLSRAQSTHVRAGLVFTRKAESPRAMSPSATATLSPFRRAAPARGRATEVVFDDAEGVAQWEWLQGMYRDGLLLSTGDADIDHYLAVAEGKAAMTIDT